MSFIEGQLNGNGTASVSSLSEAIVNEIDSFSGFAKQNDDITFILAKTTSVVGGAGAGDAAADEDAPDSPR